MFFRDEDSCKIPNKEMKKPVKLLRSIFYIAKVIVLENFLPIYNMKIMENYEIMHPWKVVDLPLVESKWQNIPKDFPLTFWSKWQQ